MTVLKVGNLLPEGESHHSVTKSMIHITERCSINLEDHFQQNPLNSVLVN